ncbi:unnamed protein product [Caenorhabditis nigoni]
MAIQPMDIVSREIAKFEPDIVTSNAAYYGIINLSDPSQVVFNVLSVTSAPVDIVVTLLCRWKIIAFTRKYQQSEALKKLHKSLEMVFSCQTIGPLISSIASLLYMLVLTDNASESAIILYENLIGRPIVFMYFVNPIVTVVFITPYRNAVSGWFRSIFPFTSASTVQPRSVTGTMFNN